MSFDFENQYLQLSLDLSRSSWSLLPKKESRLAVKSARMSFSYSIGHARKQKLEQWIHPQVSNPHTQSSHQGDIQAIQLKTGADSNGVSILVEFALSDQFPIFLWRLTLINQSSQPIFPERLTMLSIVFEPNHIFEPAFFSNGWGSWNHTGAFGAEDSFRSSRLGPFYNPMRVNAGAARPRSRGHFASDFFGILGDRKNRQALLAGFLSQKQHFGSLEACLDKKQPQLTLWANGDNARLDHGDSIRTDWACLCFLDIDHPKPMARYLNAVAREHDVNQQKYLNQDSPTGWCSWYHYFQQVTAEDVYNNLDILNKLREDIPLQVVQLDDGFETQVGDWFSFRPTFPDGVAPIAQAIRDHNFTPGIWLAPFILERNSRLAKEKPEWLLRGRFNRPVNAGFIWNQFATALDLTHPDALAYTEEVIHTAVQDWGFPYLKLDFLYAAALPGRYYNPKQTRARALRMGLERLRVAAGDNTFLLGCGCPMGSAIGIVDAMRIGADVSKQWRPQYQGIELFLQAEPDMPSTRNAIQNVLTRLPFHRVWWYNDPDCLLLRPSTDLTLAEVQSLAAVIALSDGALLLSDDLQTIPEERLRLAKALLPPIGEAARVIDWFDAATPSHLRLDMENTCGKWRLLALFNWCDTPQDIELRLTDFDMVNEGRTLIGREFWSRKIYQFTNDTIKINDVLPHGNILLAVRHLNNKNPHYLGSDLHISQGQEIIDWRWDSEQSSLSFSIEHPGNTTGQIDLYLPQAPEKVEINGYPVPWKVLEKDIYRLKVDFHKQALVHIILKRR